MTTPVPNKLLVEPPGIDPYMFGLLSVAAIREGGGKWEAGGVEYDTDACAEGGYVVGMCPARPGDHDKHFPQGLKTARGSEPFAVYTRAECNAVGFQEAAAIARRRIPLVENRVVEHFFSREVLGRAVVWQTAALPLGEQAVPVKYALGVLEQHATMHYAGQPVIHAPRWTAPFVPVQPTKDTGPVLRTILNSKVAFGTGYLDNPTDPPPYPGQEWPPTQSGQVWLFATGAVRAWRAEARVYEAFEERSNTRLALGERPYAIDHDCYVAAVLADLSKEVGAR